MDLVLLLHAVDLRSSCHLHVCQVVEAGAGAPWLLGASLPPGMTGSEVRACAANLNLEPGINPPSSLQVLSMLCIWSPWYA